MTVRGILCDLDGVVYRGAVACEGAVAGLSSARAAGVRLLFMTNNASRPPAEVAAQLTDLGVPTGPDEVLNASQVAAEVLAHRWPGEAIVESGDAVVLAIGGAGVGVALEEAGLPWAGAGQVREAAEAGAPLRVGAVVQGYGPQVSVSELTEAVYAVTAGAFWLATNDDSTLPTERGLAIGNGSLVAAVAHATGARPLVVGKPHAPAYEVALRRLGLPREDCLMIGDRLGTDIAGAVAVGLPSALVLTGVSTRGEADAAGADQRPDHIVDTIPELEHLWRQR